MSRKKEKVKLFKNVEFTDVDYAKQVYDKEKAKFKFKLVCTVISAIGNLAVTVVMSDMLNASGFMLGMQYIATVVFMVGLAATFATGPIQVLKTMFSIGKFCYCIVPFFLFDLIGFLFGLVFALFGLIYFPVLYSLKNLYQSYKDKKEAEEFLAFNNSLNQDMSNHGEMIQLKIS